MLINIKGPYVVCFRSFSQGSLDSITFDAVVLKKSKIIKFFWISCKQVHLRIGLC